MISLRLIANEHRQPISAHANLQIPDRERTLLSVKEVISTFPKLVLYFDGTSLDRCVATFYRKEGNTWMLQDEDSAEEMLEIFAECGYILDPPEEEEKPDNKALTDEQKRVHREMLADIHEGLSHVNKVGDDTS